MNTKNTFKIIIASDLHLGCYSNDPVRKNDSFRSFEETLKSCVSHKADFLLLGGDLFHHNRPTQQSIYHGLKLMRKYCLGSKKVEFEIISEHSCNFAQKVVNYEDPNFKISLPIFSIHGNHDDPTGIENLSVMDLFSTANFINYFGKIEDISKINIFPILMKKGETNLAIYGIGSIKDERLHRLFLEKKVNFIRPSSDRDTYYNIFVIHQNRVKHSYSQLNYIPEVFIPSFIDLVIWGHEHECIMEMNHSKNSVIIQPGSTVRTSLSKNEIPEKKIGLLEITGHSCKLTPIPLDTVRTFRMEDVELRALLQGKFNVDEPQLEKTLFQKVEDLLENIAMEKNFTVDEMNRKENLPLIRLRVDHSGYDVLSNQKFGNHFVGRVANYQDILLFYKRSVRIPVTDDEKKGKMEDEFSLEEIPSLIRKQIQKSKSKLSILPEKSFLSYLSEFVDKTQYSALDEFVETNVNFVRGELEKADDDSTNSKDAIRKQIQTIFAKRDAEAEMEKSLGKRDEDVGQQKSNIQQNKVSDDKKQTVSKRGKGRKSVRKNQKRKVAKEMFEGFEMSTTFEKSNANENHQKPEITKKGKTATLECFLGKGMR